MNEKVIENLLLEWLNYQRGCFAWKNNSMGVYDPIKKTFRTNKNKYVHNGVSDILGIYKGRLLAVEVKTSKGVVSRAQQIFIDRVIKEGGIAGVARSLQDLEKLIKGGDDETRS